MIVQFLVLQAFLGLLFVFTETSLVISSSSSTKSLPYSFNIYFTGSNLRIHSIIESFITNSESDKFLCISKKNQCAVNMVFPKISCNFYVTFMCKIRTLLEHLILFGLDFFLSFIDESTLVWLTNTAVIRSSIQSHSES